MQITPKERQKGSITPKRLAVAQRTLRDVGYVMLENAVDVDLLTEVRKVYLAALQRHIRSLGGLAGLEGKTFGRRHVGFFPPMKLPMANAHIAAHPIATQVLGAMLGPDFQSSFYHTNTALPGSGLQPVHRDGGLLFGTELNVPYPATSLVVNIPLCDCTEANGSTEAWPGTHLMGDADAAEGKQLEARAALLPSVRLDMPLGSLSIRDVRLWHRGVPNPSDQPRPMFAIVYHRPWVHAGSVTIPQSTWDSWPESARHIYRRNTVVPDRKHRPKTW